MKAHPFLINQDASGRRLRLLNVQERMYDESWLQKLLQLQPEILPVGEIEPIFAPLIPIGREVPTQSGSIDNLFISHRGYLVLVETKLWRNPEAKREVIAQAIEYGSSLSKWSYDRLNETTKNYLKKYENTDLDLIDWVEQKCGPVEGGPHFFEETVAKNLRLGRFLTLIVGDRIRQSMIDMLNYVNRHPHLATDVALIELPCFHWETDGHCWPLLVVPSVVARTEIVERSVIQVTINQGGTYQLDVQQERAERKGGSRSRVTLTEEASWEQLKEQSPDQYERIRALINEYRAMDGVSIEAQRMGIYVKLDTPNDQRVTLFFADYKAQLCVWPDNIGDELTKGGFDPGLAKLYGAQMRRILKMPETRIQFGSSIKEVNVDEFKSAVDTFIGNLQSAEPITD
jgi:hypothetical protein